MMKFEVGTLVKIVGDDINIPVGIVAGEYHPAHYRDVITVIISDEYRSRTRLGWAWDHRGNHAYPEDVSTHALYEMCKGKYIYNFDSGSLQSWATKLGNVL